MAREHLKESALKWYRYHQLEFHAWEDFESKFKRNYSDQRTLTERFQEMSFRVQEAGEPTDDYFYDKMRMCKALKLPFKESKQLVRDSQRKIAGVYFRCGEKEYLAHSCANELKQLTVQFVDNNLSNLKYYKAVKDYFDLRSQVCALGEDYVTKLKLKCDWNDGNEITGYGNAVTKTFRVSTCGVRSRRIDGEHEGADRTV